MKFEIEIRNTENISQITPDVMRKFEEIFSALITSGGLTGVRQGRTVLHFDADGNFQAVQLDYMPWRRRKQ